MQSVRQFLRNEAGLELTEYGVAAALIVGAILIAFGALSVAIAAHLTDLTDVVTP